MTMESGLQAARDYHDQTLGAETELHTSATRFDRVGTFALLRSFFLVLIKFTGVLNQLH